MVDKTTLLETSNSLESITNSDPSLLPNSPYYLHPGENPSAILVSPSLNKENYQAWSRSMRCALLTKNKHKFIDGSITALAKSNSLFNAWERCNTIVVSWINQSLSPQIARSMVYIPLTFLLQDF